MSEGSRVLTAVQAYNCESTIAGVVRQCLPYAPDLLVVDDGSSDQTARVACDAGARVLRHESNLGKGSAIRTAAHEAQRKGFSGLLTVDGDGQHHGDDLPRFLSAHREAPETLWVGWRQEALDLAPRMRRVGNKFSNHALEFLAGVRLPDTQCGLRLYPTDLVRRLSLRGTRYETESEILVKASALGWEMRPLPVRSNGHDGRATSHFRPWADTARICSLVTRHALQRRMASASWIGAGLFAAHIPLLAAGLGIVSPLVAAAPAVAFHLGMTLSLLRPQGQTWVDTEVSFLSAPGQAEVALTFDDGPDPVATPRVLDLLDRAQVSATFFLVGKKVERHPELASEIASRGHAIGNHTHRHLRRFSVLGPVGLADEVDRAQEAIQRACGFSPLLLRPPVGHKNPFLSRILSQRRMRCVTWTHRSGDTWGARDSRIVRHLVRRTRPGSILLLHDRICGQDRMIHTIPKLIEELSSRGFRFVTLPGTV